MLSLTESGFSTTFSKSGPLPSLYKPRNGPRQACCSEQLTLREPRRKRAGCSPGSRDAGQAQLRGLDGPRAGSDWFNQRKNTDRGFPENCSIVRARRLARGLRPLEGWHAGCRVDHHPFGLKVPGAGAPLAFPKNIWHSWRMVSVELAREAPAILSRVERTKNFAVGKHGVKSLEEDALGVIITGTNGSRRRVPWANVLSCDLEPLPAEPARQEKHGGAAREARS